MSEELSLLEHRAAKQGAKLEQATAVVAMSTERESAAAEVRKNAEAELSKLTSALKAARERVASLKAERKSAKSLAESSRHDHRQAEQELASRTKTEHKRRRRLADAEGSLAAARASLEVQEADAATLPEKNRTTTKKTSRKATSRATKKSSPRAATEKQAPAKRTPAQKAPAKKTPAKTATQATTSERAGRKATKNPSGR